MRDDSVPHNIRTERAILGAFLNNNESLDTIEDVLKPDCFFMPLHREIYQTMLLLRERKLVLTPLTIERSLSSKVLIEGKTCFEYLAEIMAESIMVFDVESLGRIILDDYLRRQLIIISHEAIKLALDKSEVEKDAHYGLESTEQKLFNLAVNGTAERSAVSVGNAVRGSLYRIEQAKKKQNHLSGVSSGFIQMDKLTAGLQDSDLIILAGRPSMGKTSLAVNIALNAAVAFQQAKAVCFFSLEMSAEQLANRVLSICTGIDGNKIRTGYVSTEEFAILSRETTKISMLPLFIDDTPALSITQLRTRSRRLKRKNNLGLIVVDYLQLIRPSYSASYGNRVQEIGEISQGLKALAKELQLPVIALSQLSRAVESREDKRPQLQDLRESGNIEQDADVVMFVYREEYYLERTVPAEGNKRIEWEKKLDSARNTAEVIISKQRNGPIGALSLHFNSATTSFSNLFVELSGNP